jgi:hypothetical protein
MSSTVFFHEIHLLNCVVFSEQSQFFSPQNAVYFMMLYFLVHKMFNFHIKGALKFECLALEQENMSSSDTVGCTKFRRNVASTCFS